MAIAQQDDIAGDLAASHHQLLSIRSPVEIEDSPGGELGQLFGFPSGKAFGQLYGL